MNLLTTINPQNISTEVANQYRVREAARAVVFDDDHNVALLHVSEYQYYKLPGGGIDEGESPLAALQRECLEEIGCQVEVTGEIGKIVEHRKMFQVKQVSYCYLAKVTGEKGQPSFTQKELTEGFEQLWVPYQEAVSLISENKAIGLEGKSYIVPRDTVFISAAEQFIHNAK